MKGSEGGNPAIALVNYGLGNIRSIYGAFRELGHQVILTASYRDIVEADIAVLPGVGSAMTGLKNLRCMGLGEALRERCILGLPIIGICLGAQMLLGPNDEAGGLDGLSLINGSVVSLGGGDVNTGWRSIDFDQLRRVGLSSGLRPTSTYFFNHEYRVNIEANDAMQVLTTGRRIPAVFVSENILGIQFHPEKSQSAGIRFLRNAIQYVSN